MSTRRIQLRAAALAFVVGLSGCAAKQPIAIDCVPEEVVIYIDGEKIHGVPAEVSLRTDRPHTLFFKGPGIEPELVVLRQTTVAGRAALEPALVCVEPRYKQVRRQLEVEIAPDVAAGPPIGAASRSTVEVAPRPEFEPDLP